MFKSIYYNTKTNTIHLWEEIQGENFYDEIYWTPYCFIDDPKGEISTIYGTKAKKVDFNSNTEYQNFCKNRNDVHENKVLPTIQFLAEKYHHIKIEDTEPPSLKIYSLDIEVDVPENSSFPNVEYTEYPISLMTITDLSANVVYSFGVKPYENKTDYKVYYFNCDNEESLLKKFYSWWKNNCPDVITGWNINADYKVNTFGGFDMPYIINRTKKLFGDKTKWYKKLSPLNIVNIFQRNENDVFIVDIAGVNILDYQALYKWYSSRNLENVQLETVCQYELGTGKIKFDGSFNWLYENDWQKYVDYNIEDTYLIKKLEDKLGYIKLAQFVTLLCRCPMKMYSSTTNLIEGLMLTRFRRENKCAPYFAGGQQEHFDAAYVKNPKIGKKEWLFSLDIASSYPFSIITLNMSPETYFGKIVGLKESEIREYIIKKEFPKLKITKTWKKIDDKLLIDISDEKLKTFNNALKRKIFSIAPNGVMFYNKPKGVFASMERDVYLKRKEIKRMMYDETKKYNKTKDIKHKNKKENLHALQWALKIVLNGAFGCTSVPYSRWFQPHIAQAIPSVGKASLLFGEKYTNEIMNNPTKEIIDILTKIKMEI